MALTTVTITASGTWRVPGHVPGTLKMIAVGGGGGDYQPGAGTLTNRGGIAGYVRGTLDIARGTLLTIGIGGRGDDAETSYVDLPLGGAGPRPGGDGGLFGSGVPASAGAGGGGGTEVKIGSTIVAVGGGGGGGGTKAAFSSGNRAGGGAAQTGSGADGSPTAPTDVRGQGGLGGTTSAAGAGGAAATSAPEVVGFAGSGGAGGDGGSFVGSPATNRGGGGGGGGGYFGGGGGGGSRLSADAGRGGGGSSWSNATYVTEGAVGSTLTVPVDNVAGYVTFEFEPAPGRRGLGLIRG